MSTSWGYLTKCRCGHVANHHAGPTQRCQVADCRCMAFDAGDARVQEIIREANRRLRKAYAERDEARAELASMKDSR